MACVVSGLAKRACKGAGASATAAATAADRQLGGGIEDDDDEELADEGPDPETPAGAEVAAMLLAAGAEAGVLDQHGCSPLMYAAGVALAGGGAVAGVLDQHGYSPLMYAAGVAVVCVWGGQ